MQDIISLLEKFGFPVCTTLISFYFIYFLIVKFSATIMSLNDSFNRLNSNIEKCTYRIEDAARVIDDVKNEQSKILERLSNKNN